MQEQSDDLEISESYPNQWLCFWLGCVPIGIIGASITLPSSRPVTPIDCLWYFAISIALFGIPVGLLSLIIGYFVEDTLRQMGLQKASRLVWLLFLVPAITIGCLAAFVFLLFCAF